MAVAVAVCRVAVCRVATCRLAMLVGALLQYFRCALHWATSHCAAGDCIALIAAVLACYNGGPGR